MSVFEVVKARRSVGKMKPERPTREKIERILEAATYAPNHHEAEPWQFFVLSGPAREQLGALMAERLAGKLTETVSEKSQAALTKERTKLLRAPVVIAVACLRPSVPKVMDIENVEATSAAIQNMLLVAQEEGLASIWRTGDAAYDPKIKAFFGLQPDEHLIGFVYLGYPAVPIIPRQPTSFERKTHWLGWED